MRMASNMGTVLCLRYPTLLLIFSSSFPHHSFPFYLTPLHFPDLLLRAFTSHFARREEKCKKPQKRLCNIFDLLSFFVSLPGKWKTLGLLYTTKQHNSSCLYIYLSIKVACISAWVNMMRRADHFFSTKLLLLACTFLVDSHSFSFYFICCNFHFLFLFFPYLYFLVGLLALLACCSTGKNMLFYTHTKALDKRKIVILLPSFQNNRRSHILCLLAVGWTSQIRCLFSLRYVMLLGCIGVFEEICNALKRVQHVFKMWESQINCYKYVISSRGEWYRKLGVCEEDLILMTGISAKARACHFSIIWQWMDATGENGKENVWIMDTE